MMNLPHSKKALFAICSALTLAVLLAACDVMEDDPSPSTPEVEIKDNEFHILSNGNAYIDLYSLVKTNGKIRFDISTQPGKGDLSEAAKGMLRYAPFKGFEKGRDSFTLSVFDEGGSVLLSDTVVIIVEDDTTNLPCGYFAVDDYVSSSSSPVVIDVLQNDFLCGDSSNVRVEIYRPDNTFPPFRGTASVVNNRIVYQGSSTVLTDSIIYKVSHVSNNSLIGFAMVHVNINGNCTPTAFDDYFVHDNHNKQIDTVDLFVLRNDAFCGNTVNALSVLEAPNHGDAFVVASDTAQWIIKYAYELPQGDSTHFSDSLRYQFRVGSQWYNAKTRIDIH